MKTQPKIRAGKSAFTLIELLVVVAIIALLISILLPSLARAREIAKRTACAANLKGIGTGMNTWASTHKGMFPNSGGTTVGASLDSLSLLVTGRTISSANKAFICPSSEDTAKDLGNALDWNSCSYGYQVPYGPYGIPGTDMDLDMALVADKGPYGAAIAGGKTLTPSAVNPLDASGNPRSAEAWRPLNSLNHGGLGDGEGQNVMYLDGRADWFATPLAGVLKDNIYTVWKITGTGTTLKIFRAVGIAPDKATTMFTTTSFPSEGRVNPAPYANTDSLIYP